MGLARTVPLVVVILGAAIFASFRLYERWAAVEPVRLEPLQLPLPMPSNGFLESRIAEIVVAENERSWKEPSSSDDNSAASGTAEATASPGLSENFEVEGSHLKQVAKEFVYTRYGKIGDKGIATLMDLRSYETTTKSEGSSYRGLGIAQVEENSILLTYPGEDELRKPRIELDVEPLSPGEDDPEKAQALWTRHQEIWGNRTEGSSKETSFSRSAPPPSPDEIERQRAARKLYLEKMSAFHRRLEAEDPTLDPRASPLLPTAGEVARDSLPKAQGALQADESHSEEEDSVQGAEQP